MHPQKYFVTGGAGFIGSHLVDRLIDEGHQVTVYDNLTSGKKGFIKRHLDNPSLRLIQADLLDFAAVEAAIKGHEVVFHLSANPDARWGIDNTRLDLEQETIATYNVMESMRRNNIRKIVFSSSGTIYGETPVISLQEDYGPALPASLYGAGKLASEGLVSAFCHTFDMQSWIFRFVNIIGDRATHGVIYDFINKLKKNPHELEILGDGTQCKPYMHVNDCVDGILFGFRNSHEKVNLYNLGCPTATDVTTIASVLVEEMGLKNVRFNYTGGNRGWPGDVPQVRVNVSKMTKLGWSTVHTSDEAVRNAIRDILAEEQGR